MVAMADSVGGGYLPNTSSPLRTRRRCPHGRSGLRQFGWTERRVGGWAGDGARDPSGAKEVLLRPWQQCERAVPSDFRGEVDVGMAALVGGVRLLIAVTWREGLRCWDNT